MDRNDTIQRIKTALRGRSGKAWSVTGGQGTAWGWITIDALPARRTCHTVKREGATSNRPEDYEERDTGRPGGMMTVQDRQELARLFGLERVHCQGVSIPASCDYRQEYIDRAEGKFPSVVGKPYWD